MSLRLPHDPERLRLPTPPPLTPEQHAAQAEGLAVEKKLCEAWNSREHRATHRDENGNLVYRSEEYKTDKAMRERVRILRMTPEQRAEFRRKKNEVGKKYYQRNKARLLTELAAKTRTMSDEEREKLKKRNRESQQRCRDIKKIING